MATRAIYCKKLGGRVNVYSADARDYHRFIINYLVRCSWAIQRFLSTPFHDMYVLVAAVTLAVNLRSADESLKKNSGNRVARFDRKVNVKYFKL